MRKDGTEIIIYELGYQYHGAVQSIFYETWDAVQGSAESDTQSDNVIDETGVSVSVSKGLFRVQWDYKPLPVQERVSRRMMVCPDPLSKTTGVGYMYEIDVPTEAVTT